jgi:dethiobiotin synthetase
MTSSTARGYFITGTDTGVGKTVVAAGIVRVLAERGHRVVGLKPVASGSVLTPQGLRNSDALALASESSIRRPYELTNPYCFEPGVAPHLAARDVGVSVTLDDLVNWYGRATAGSEVAIIEGAGGWRVPLHPDGFLSDLPERLGLGVILVVGLRLGCLSHARLAFEAIARAGRSPFVGWIGSQVEPGLERLDGNVETLGRLLGAPALALVPPLPDASSAAAAVHLARPQLLRALGVEP